MPAARTHAVSLRTSLLRSFALLILLSSLTVLVLMWVRSLEVEKDLSGRLTGRGTERASRELEAFLEPARSGTLMALAWGRSGQLGLGDVVGGDPGTTRAGQTSAAARLNALLLPFLRVSSALSSVQLADGDGRGFLVLQLPDGRVVNRIVDRSSWGASTLWFDVAVDGTPSGPTWKDVDYEPRRRAWYELAAAAPPGEVCWTDAYTFATTKDLGITVSGRWRAGEQDVVVAFDVLLNDLSLFTQDEASRVSANALTVIATRDGRVLGLPRGAAETLEPTAARALYLRPLIDLDVAAVRDGARARAQASGATDAVFSYESGGDDWWAGFREHALDAKHALEIGVFVPSADLLAEVHQQRLFILVATAVALLAALLYSLVLSRSYSRPIEALVQQSSRIRDLDFASDDQVDARLKEFQALAQAQRQSVAALQSFSRYVPVEVVRQLVGAGEVARIGGRTETLSVLFTDIAGFTSIAEGMTPQALADHMASYFQALIEALHGTGATVDKIVGDAIVAFWGAPRRLEDHAARAVRGVLQCRRALEVLRGPWRQQGLPELPTRFGLSLGPVVVGNIGAPSRLAYTAIGDTMNVASRLEALNKEYGTRVLVDDAIRQGAGDGFLWRRVDHIVVLGKTSPMLVHELLGAPGDVPAELVAAAAGDEKAWDAYAQRDFARARELLDELLVAAPSDGPSLRLRGVVQQLIDEPPPPDWTAVTWHAVKA